MARVQRATATHESGRRSNAFLAGNVTTDTIRARPSQSAHCTSTDDFQRAALGFEAAANALDERGADALLMLANSIRRRGRLATAIGGLAQ